MNKKKVVLGVLAAFAAGAAVGVLFAPDKGSKTRNDIARKGDDLADQIKDSIDDKFAELADSILGKRRAESRTPDEGKGSGSPA